AGSNLILWRCNLPRAKIQGAPRGALLRLRELGAVMDHVTILHCGDEDRQSSALRLTAADSEGEYSPHSGWRPGGPTLPPDTDCRTHADTHPWEFQVGGQPRDRQPRRRPSGTARS